MSQSEQFHEAWSYLRDNAKPVVPRDVDELAAVREQTPPSRAHIRRIQRDRPEITVAIPVRDTTAPARLDINRLINMGEATARACGMYVERIYR